MHWQPASTLDYFALLVADDQRFPLTEAAAAVAQTEFPELDLDAVMDQIDALAARLLARLPQDAGALQRVKALHSYFFGELGFSGNINDYYSPANSYVHEVLRTRRGIPITLAVIYLDLAHRVGLKAGGVSFPGHFMIKLHLPMGDAMIDPVTGSSLSKEVLEERLEPYLDRYNLPMGGRHSLAAFLGEAPAREIVARMLRNLEAIHRAAEDWPRLLAVQQRLVVLQPQDWDWRRDRGLTYAQLGQTERAIADLCEYLRHATAAADHAAIEAQLRALRDAGPPRLH